MNTQVTQSDLLEIIADQKRALEAMQASLMLARHEASR